MKGAKIRFRPSKPRGDVGRFYLELTDPPPGAKPLIPCVDPKTRIPLYTHRSDREKVERWAEQTIAPVLAPILKLTLETCDAWMDRFVKSRTGKVTTVDRDHQQWRKWVSPVKLASGVTFGKRAIAHVTADDVEAVRDHLDAAIDAWEAAGKKRGVGMSFSTGANVWSILTCAMRHASTRKGARDLRVREAQGNPCTGINPPRIGRGKRRHWLRSAWVNAALASPDNPTPIKEAVAIGIGIHLRPGELHELRVKDLDLDAGEVSITRSFDEDSGKVTSTKTEEGVRNVTAPAWLLPLLARIADERGPNERVAPWVALTPESDRAPAFRRFLRNGGAVPEEILKDSATHEAVDYRTCRDTGITWRFLAGERAEVVQRESGHQHIATTLGYAKEVSNKGNRYGAPALVLPSDLVSTNGGAGYAQCAITSDLVGNEVPELLGNKKRKARDYAGLSVARVGFEPTTFGL